MHPNRSVGVTGCPVWCYAASIVKSLDKSAWRMYRLYQEIAKYVADYPEMIYGKNRVILGIKNGQKAPRFVSFCSMYGDVLSYPVDHAGVATMDQMGRGGAHAHRAPHRFASLERMKARQVGLEPTTSRLIPIGRDSTIEQILAEPPGGFHFLDP